MSTPMEQHYDVCRYRELHQVQVHGLRVCPVDCFYAGENMLVIHPDECIDCGVCEPEGPAKAIKADTEPGVETWLKLNREFAAKWPNMSERGTPPSDAK